MKRIILGLGFLVVVTFSCEEALTDTGVEPAFLLQQWTHSIEEQNEANSVVRIFRPSDSREFATARFRDAYEFKEDGICHYMFLHPADAHHMKDGTYAYDAEKSTIRIFSEDGDFLKEFTLHQLNSDILIMELTELG